MVVSCATIWSSEQPKRLTVRSEKQRKRDREYQVEYMADPVNAAKVKARQACKYAVKSGKLTRLPCEECGAAKSHAHHEDYSKPFDVKWLCAACHAVLHRKSHCIHGHALTPDNIVMQPRRKCRQCSRERDKRRDYSSRDYSGRKNKQSALA
jgi:hypothetical protein